MRTLPWLARHAAAPCGAAQGAIAQGSVAQVGVTPCSGLRTGDMVATGATLVVKAHRSDVVDLGFDGLPGVRLHIA